MKKLILCIAIIFTSCSYQAKEQRAASKIDEYRVKYPRLFSNTIDTFILAYKDTTITPFRELDTTFYSDLDTIVVAGDKIETTVYIDRVETITKYRIKTVVEPDTFIQIKYKTRYVTKEIIEAPKTNNLKIYLIVLVCLLGFVLLSRAYRNLFKNEKRN